MKEHDDHRHPTNGALLVFEGADGVGKSTLAEAVVQRLRKEGTGVLELSFPGRQQGTLGRLVYDVHHEPGAFGLSGISPTSLQVLHVAAHIDCIETRIRPALTEGKTVILDRFWWSTVAYGKAAGVPSEVLEAMVALEATAWGSLLPDFAFLVTRDEPFRAELSSCEWSRVCMAYRDLAEREGKRYPVQIIENYGAVETAIQRIYTHVMARPSNRKGQKRTKAGTAPRRRGAAGRDRWSPTKTTPVFDTYWRFAAERQAIFFKRIAGEPWPWTDDAILREYKFTNAYRASDRVSQYLIRNVIYSGDQAPAEVLFRILLFKFFNKIETWELLLHELGRVTWSDFDFRRYDDVLTKAIESRRRIYSGAYIMPSGGRSLPHRAKHRNHLDLLQLMMGDDLADRVRAAKSMLDLFDLLRGYPTLGDFLAYQYATDINYSTITDFSEMSFVVPGPGARDGLRKCFSDPGGLSEVDLIKRTADRQEEEFGRLGLEFQSLWGRPLQLIDCQNLFCEVDKYARAAHPDIAGLSGRTRIKQKHRPNLEPIHFFYPPKWGLKTRVEATLNEAKGKRAKGE